MSIRVTITKPNVTDAYGLPMVVGSTYTVSDDFGLSLIQQGKASDTDSSLTNPGVREADALGVVYCNAATLAAPTAQMLASYNTVFALDVAPFTRYRSNGTYLVLEGQYSTDTSGNILGLLSPTGTVVVSPRVVFQTAIPFILPGGSATSQFTISATGALSNITAMPVSTGFGFFYMPSGITGLSSGWYYGQILSTTTAQLSTATYTSGDPQLAVPTTFTNPSGITPGNYTQATSATADIAGPIATVSGGALGANGAIDLYSMFTVTNNANAKPVALKVNGLTISTSTGLASVTGNKYWHTLANANSQSRQMMQAGVGALSTGGSTLGSNIDTSATSTWAYYFEISVASDTLFMSWFAVEVRYGA